MDLNKFVENAIKRTKREVPKTFRQFLWSFGLGLVFALGLVLLVMDPGDPFSYSQMTAIVLVSASFGIPLKILPMWNEYVFVKSFLGRSFTDGEIEQAVEVLVGFQKNTRYGELVQQYGELPVNMLVLARALRPKTRFFRLTPKVKLTLMVSLSRIKAHNKE